MSPFTGLSVLTSFLLPDNAQVPSACSIAAISHRLFTHLTLDLVAWHYFQICAFPRHILSPLFPEMIFGCGPHGHHYIPMAPSESSVAFCFLSLSIQIFPHSSLFYPEDGAVIFFNTVTVYRTAWCRTPEDTFHQLTAHNATWVYSWWYMCPCLCLWSQHLFHMESLHLSGHFIIAAVLRHSERDSVHYCHWRHMQGDACASVAEVSQNMGERRQ
jgi:hypothetical protein